jgi:hypothetical protein
MILIVRCEELLVFAPLWIVCSFWLVFGMIDPTFFMGWRPISSGSMPSGIINELEIRVCSCSSHPQGLSPSGRD